MNVEGMAPALRIGLLLAAAYLLGSLPWSLWTARARGVDLRATGSGNLGATNVYRALGPRWGLVVLALDMAKGAAAVALTRRFAAGLPPFVPVLALLVAVLGHVFTVFAGFRGGKGVAAGLGGFLALAPAAGALALAVWALLFALSRTVSLASLVAFLALPFATWLTSRARADFPYLLGLTVLMGVLVWVRHRANLQRLLTGQERPLRLRS